MVKGRGRAESSKGEASAVTSKLHAVEEWNHLVKKILKPYPDERGSFVKTRGRSLKSFFGEENMRHMAADAQVCELAARPGMGLNLLAASCQQGLEALMCITDDADPAADQGAFRGPC